MMLQKLLARGVQMDSDEEELDDEVIVCVLFVYVLFVFSHQIIQF